MNNLNKKYKTVKDKSKSTGEGSEEIKSFPEFTDLDELWGTRDTVTNKYVVEAGSNDQPSKQMLCKIQRARIVRSTFPVPSSSTFNKHLHLHFSLPNARSTTNLLLFMALLNLA